jgi:hypothetical protein
MAGIDRDVEAKAGLEQKEMTAEDQAELNRDRLQNFLRTIERERMDELSIAFRLKDPEAQKLFEETTQIIAYEIQQGQVIIPDMSLPKPVNDEDAMPNLSSGRPTSQMAKADSTPIESPKSDAKEENKRHLAAAAQAEAAPPEDADVPAITPSFQTQEPPVEEADQQVVAPPLVQTQVVSAINRRAMRR